MNRDLLLQNVQEQIRLHHNLKVWMKYLFMAALLLPVLTYWLKQLETFFWIVLLILSLLTWACLLVLGYAIYTSQHRIEEQIRFLETVR